jgi:hypothetical protein
MIDILSQQGKDAEAVARELVTRAVDNDGSDNTTAQVVLVHAVEIAAMYRGREIPLER